MTRGIKGTDETMIVALIVVNSLLDHYVVQCLQVNRFGVQPTSLPQYDSRDDCSRSTALKNPCRSNSEVL